MLATRVKRWARGRFLTSCNIGRVIPCRNEHNSQKLFHSSTRSVGVALDIDGVLIRGDQALPYARESLLRLQQHDIPYVFLTNGGGVLEAEKAEKLAEILQMDVEPEKVILSHTPMHELVPKYRDRKILIVGSSNVMAVARHYGFNKIVSCQDLVKHDPHMYPFVHRDQSDEPYPNEEVEGVLMLNDSIDWSIDMQVVLDSLIGGFPLGSGRICKSQTPMYASNDDFNWSAAYPVPRLAQGAFTKCLAQLYEGTTGTSLVITKYGKPTTKTYKYAESVLNAMYRSMNPTDDPSATLSTIYGIGDNPFSDIQGANNAGDHWSSILVRTGNFQGSNHPDHPADHVCDHVDHAIDYILEKATSLSPFK